jgi:hypothetical protein
LSDLGVFNRFNSSWAWATSRKASAKWDSASVALLVADTMRVSNESASSLAPVAMVRADDEAVIALADASVAASDSVLATPTLVASPSSRIVSPSAFVATAFSLSWSDPKVSRACSSCLSSRIKALPSKMKSPAIPDVTRSGPIEWMSIFLNAQRSNAVDLRNIHLPTISVRVLRLCQYSMTAPNMRIAAEIAAAHWSALRLLQNDDDHKGAEKAVASNIWDSIRKKHYMDHKKHK